MSRKVRIIHMPLGPLKDADIKSLVLSHWALLIGENDLLLEIFPAERKKITKTPIEFRFKRLPDLRKRKATFKFGIFRQADTDKADEVIIEAAEAIVARNPFYSLAGYNCQSFVNDLVEAIAIPSFGNEFKKKIRKFPLVQAFIYRSDDETTSTAIDTSREAEAQLQYLVHEGLKLSSQGTQAKDVDIPTELEVPSVDATSGLGLLWPTSQVYLLIDDEDDLTSIGIALVYGTAENPEFELAGIQVPTDPDDLTVEEMELLQITQALVGEDEWC